MANGDNDLDDFLNKKGISNKAETATADVVEEKVEVEEEVSTSNNDLDSFLKKKGIGEGVKKKRRLRCTFKFRGGSYGVCIFYRGSKYFFGFLRRNR